MTMSLISSRAYNEYGVLGSPTEATYIYIYIYIYNSFYLLYNKNK